MPSLIAVSVATVVRVATLWRRCFPSFSHSFHHDQSLVERW
jgi:hypothetical protein